MERVLLETEVFISGVQLVDKLKARTEHWGRLTFKRRAGKVIPGGVIAW